jgi:UDP-N-acetylmuramoylalanine--D-glutamate ligase
MLLNIKKLELKDKKVTVVGLGRSGIGAANLLAAMGAVVTVNDREQEDELTDSIKRLAPSVRVNLGGHPEDIFVSADMIVVSPGVPLEIKPIESAKAKGIPVIGEIELAYQILESQRLKDGSMIPFLAITGSNGKSTTTALLDCMLRKGGFKTFIGGNIGNALTEGILRKVRIQNSEFRIQKTDFIVLEVSSFQLEAIDKFRPHISAILNITPDHLDRYNSMAEYSKAKAQILLNQNNQDFVVINADDPETMNKKNEKLEVRNIKPQIYFFSLQKEVKGVYCKNGQVYCNMPDLPHAPSPSAPLIAANEVKIKGVHNLENAMAAAAMALLANCPHKAVTESLIEFEGLEHRLEFVREVDGVKYFNDSKGTNVGAVVKSIKSFQEPLILIAGGRDKAGDFSLLRKLVGEKVKALVLIGEAAGKIKGALSDVTDTVMAKDLNEAVNISRDITERGDVVLLSPACASFDMFQSFEDRGRQFKALVKGLKKQYE